MKYKTTPYKRGRDYEYKVMAKLRAIGYDIVIRAAGSHTPIDIIAINSTNKIMKLVQCKKGMNEKQKEKILKEISFLNGNYNVLTNVV